MVESVIEVWICSTGALVAEAGPCRLGVGAVYVQRMGYPMMKNTTFLCE